ncbi:uncharacterized protein DS421_3g72140 [Arachis hypogaea]|nr:uncharacterized protein DS421_3g72140 [Arachis hypogaea]
MKECRCASIAAVSSRSTIVEGSHRLSRLHLERVTASIAVASPFTDDVEDAQERQRRGGRKTEEEGGGDVRAAVPSCRSWSHRHHCLAEDDASLVKQIGQSFQYSKIEERREEQIQAAHDEAMFGASALPPPTSTNSEPERENEKEVDKKAVVTSLLSETEC